LLPAAPREPANTRVPLGFVEQFESQGTSRQDPACSRSPGGWLPQKPRPSLAAGSDEPGGMETGLGLQGCGLLKALFVPHATRIEVYHDGLFSCRRCQADPALAALACVDLGTNFIHERRSEAELALRACARSASPAAPELRRSAAVSATLRFWPPGLPAAEGWLHFRSQRLPAISVDLHYSTATGAGIPAPNAACCVPSEHHWRSIKRGIEEQLTRSWCLVSPARAEGDREGPWRHSLPRSLGGRSRSRPHFLTGR